MLFVFNKDRVITYILAVVCVVFMFSFVNVNNREDTLETSSRATKELPIYNVKTDQNKIALTFDCAWDADDMPQILEILDKNNVKATFFLVGTWIDKYPDTVKQIADKGHDVANHSDTHAHVANISYEKNINEIGDCCNKIEVLTGKKSNLYRGPYGEYNDTVIRAAKDKDHVVIQWNIDTLDWKELTGPEMIKRIEKNLKPGSIILMHNGTKHTAESLQSIIDYIKKEGYEIVPVSELIYKENFTINSQGEQIGSYKSAE